MARLGMSLALFQAKQLVVSTCLDPQIQGPEAGPPAPSFALNLLVSN